MLKAIEIDNFKAFGERTRIEMAPITLIFGQNSAGKTSILHALNLLKQSVDPGTEVLVPRGKFVDLGSFRELIFDHDLSRTVRIALSAGPEIGPTGMGPEDDDATAVGSLGIAFNYRQKSPASPISLEKLELLWDQISEPLAELGPLYDDERPSEESPPQKIWDVKYETSSPCRRISRSHLVWTSIYQFALKNRRRICSEVREAIKKEKDFARDIQDTKWSKQWATIVGQLTAALKLYSSPFSLSAFISRMAVVARGTEIPIEGLLPAGEFGNSSSAPDLKLIESELFPRRGAGDRMPMAALKGGQVVLPGFLHRSFHAAGRSVARMLDSLFPLGPVRRLPERYYIYSGSPAHDVGYRGDHLPDLLFRYPKLIRRANDWLRRLDLGYQLRLHSLGAKSSELFELRLVDRRRATEVDVGLTDVGFGISQILPFIVQCLASRRRIISIEQPEVHIHPKLQADLGDLIAASIGDPHRHQFLIETHSEHLVLRLQKLIRLKTLAPSDVSILFVERGSAGSRVQRLHLDEQGEFVTEWPGGFFPERLRELM